MDYKIIRHHRRKKLLLTVSPTGEIAVKAGLLTPLKIIDNFVNANKDWIEKQQQFFAQKYHTRIITTKAERDSAKKQLLPVMISLVQKYAAVMDVEPKSVKITVAEKRWGSCSGRDTVCFSYRCYFLSQKCKEYIVIHELSHLKEFNHSKEFYKTVQKYMPDYKQAEKELDGYYIHTEQ